VRKSKKHQKFTTKTPADKQPELAPCGSLTNLIPRISTGGNRENGGASRVASASTQSIIQNPKFKIIFSS
jgi:hypothetical protein